MRYLLTALAVAVIAMPVVTAPVATAAPECTKVGPTTTQCETPGNAQIITSPPPMNYGPFYGSFYGSPYDDVFGFRR